MEAYRRWKARKSHHRMLETEKQPGSRRRRRPGELRDRRRLDVIIISAQDLKKVSRFRRQEPYAVARIDQLDELRTPADRQGEGRHPTWNTILSFEVEQEVLEQEMAMLSVEMYTKGVFRDKIVGSVRILLSDLLVNASCCKCLTFMVMRPSGRRQGVLNIGVPPSCSRGSSGEFELNGADVEPSDGREKLVP